MEKSRVFTECEHERGLLSHKDFQNLSDDNIPINLRFCVAMQKSQISSKHEDKSAYMLVFNMSPEIRVHWFFKLQANRNLEYNRLLKAMM